MTLDPYRTLGIAPGASAAEIKRAYRRLVKEHHPDSGGPAELPRFLAIQAAYEMLTSGRALGPGFSYGAGPGGPGGGTGTSAAGATGAGPAWRADPARARATREAWRRGPRGRSTGDGGDAGTAGWTAAPGGASGTSEPGTASRGAGTTSEGAGTAGASPGAAGEGGGRRAQGTGGAESGRGPAGGPGGGGERHREGTRHGRGPRRKATPGSTTYDEAHHEPGEPGEPGWTGSSWYGQTSGTYWTINPREYADPRKHGPEYLARARKAAQSGGGATDDGDAPGSTGAAGTRPPRTYARQGTSMRGDPASAAGTSAPGASSPDPAPHSPPPGPVDEARPVAAAQSGNGGPAGEDEPPQPAGERPPPGEGSAAGAGGGPTGDRGSPASGRTSPPGERPAQGPATRTPGDRRPTGRPQPSPRPASPAARAVRPGYGDSAFGPPVDLAGTVDGILRAPARPRTRLVLALSAWPPLGIAAMLVLGEISGCARFAASCASTSSFAVGVLAAQVGILSLLLVVPAVARLTAVGSLASVVAALPAMAFLTAIGAPYSPQGGPASLLALLGVAWLGGVILAWRSRQAGHDRGDGSLGGPNEEPRDDGSPVAVSADSPSRTMGP